MRLFHVLCCLLTFGSVHAAELQGQGGISQSAVANGVNSRALNAARDINYNYNYHYNGDQKNRVEVIGSKVAITSAYLLPSYDFIDKVKKVQDGTMQNQFRDSAFLCVEVANISSQPLLVTAMRLELIDAQGFRRGPGSFGGCPGSNVASVTPECILQPGQRKKWLLDRGIVIPGVVDFLGQQSDEYIFDELRPRLTTNTMIIDRFNDFLQTVGDKTMLKVSIFELNYQPILIGHFQLAKGKDLFHREPAIQKVSKKPILVYPLQHDYFLGEALSQIKSGKTDSPSSGCVLQ